LSRRRNPSPIPQRAEGGQILAITLRAQPILALPKADGPLPMSAKVDHFVMAITENA
jgi:hypothetical protein